MLAAPCFWCVSRADEGVKSQCSIMLPWRPRELTCEETSTKKPPAQVISSLHSLERQASARSFTQACRLLILVFWAYLHALKELPYQAVDILMQQKARHPIQSTALQNLKQPHVLSAHSPFKTPLKSVPAARSRFTKMHSWYLGLQHSLISLCTATAEVMCLAQNVWCIL